MVARVLLLLLPMWMLAVRAYRPAVSLCRAHRPLTHRARHLCAALPTPADPDATAASASSSASGASAAPPAAAATAAAAATTATAATATAAAAAAAPTAKAHVAAGASAGVSADASAVAYTTLAELPDFRGPSRLLKAAFKASQEVKPNPKIGNARKRAVNFACRRVDAYASGITVALREQRDAFRTHMAGLSPFEAALAELTLQALTREGLPSQQAVVSAFERMRRAVVREGKAASAAAAAAASKEEAGRLMEAGLGKVQEVFEAEAEALHTLIRTGQRLRRLPRVQTDEGVVVLVGMPNVGKSSIVTAISSGTPEVNAYPFTTRRLLLGHVLHPNRRFQVMDTPGVLSRANEDRNPMEGLTLAAAELLPSAIVFVLDLSGTSGSQSSPTLQLSVREQIRKQFPDRPWLDVRSKSDLPLAEEVGAGDIPSGTLEVSVQEGLGTDELARRMDGLVDALQAQGLVISGTRTSSRDSDRSKY